MFLKNILKETANADVSIPEESSQLEVYITKNIVLEETGNINISVTGEN